MKDKFGKVYFWVILLLISGLFLLIGNVDFENHKERETRIIPAIISNDSLSQKNIDTAKGGGSQELSKLNELQ